jgi:hypothetical protein
LANKNEGLIGVTAMFNRQTVPEQAQEMQTLDEVMTKTHKVLTHCKLLVTEVLT